MFTVSKSYRYVLIQESSNRIPASTQLANYREKLEKRSAWALTTSRNCSWVSASSKASYLPATRGAPSSRPQAPARSPPSLLFDVRRGYSPVSPFACRRPHARSRRSHEAVARASAQDGERRPQARARGRGGRRPSLRGSELAVAAAVVPP